MEKYEGSIKVAFDFDDIPPIHLTTIQWTGEDPPTWWQRIALATKRRLFNLNNDWRITLEDITYAPKLNGGVIIPCCDEAGDKIEFDGASVPLPWLVSLLTIGVLRPLGVMLVASLVHDYAYMYGRLRKEDGSFVPIERDIADRLFKDIIATVQGLPFIGYIAWFFVRIGWPFIKYNHKPQGGKAPIFEYLILILALLLFVSMGIQYSFRSIALVFVALYVLFYLGSIAIVKLKMS